MFTGCARASSARRADRTMNPVSTVFGSGNKIICKIDKVLKSFIINNKITTSNGYNDNDIYNMKFLSITTLATFIIVLPSLHSIH